jgi:hypothetical protein
MIAASLGLLIVAVILNSLLMLVTTVFGVVLFTAAAIYKAINRKRFYGMTGFSLREC